MIVVIFALVSVIGFLTYGFKGIGKFAIDFLPWHLSANEYALILMGITTFYVVKGGMFSVVITEVLQFCILSIASIAIGIIAIARVSPEALRRAIPAGWDQIWFGWHLNLDWSDLIAAVNTKIAEDGYSHLRRILHDDAVQGHPASALPDPRPTTTCSASSPRKNPREASMMSAMVNVVLNVPRYFMITGLTILALVFYSDKIRAMGQKMDFEMVLPDALSQFVPAGLLGLLVAGLLAAFMSNFAATVNAAPPYIVNDLYRKFINPHASERNCVRLSYLASFAVVVLGISFGWFVEFHQYRDPVDRLGAVGRLHGLQRPEVVLVAFQRLRLFLGHGHRHGRIADYVPAFPNVHPLNLFPIIVGLALIGCIVGTLRTKPEEDAVLMDFYKRVNPWGFWGPIREKVMREDPSFKPNPDFARDMFNIVVGIAWQTSLIAFPVYIVIRRYEIAAWAIAVVVVTSITLKFTWYDHLKKMEIAPA